MKIAIITGSAGLIGSEAAVFFSDKFDLVVGIDNNLRQYFFGEESSTDWNRKRLENQLPNYRHYTADIRDIPQLEAIFKEYGSDVKLILHTAAQPSHDWAAKEPFTDFTVNANGTLNMLEMNRLHCPEAVFIFTSTNKVYGDNPNFLPLVELETRYEISESHPYYKNGIDELMSIDQTKHSLFGASKASADLLVQEYGRYFQMPTCCLRGGCLTGPDHAGVELHGFLSYLIKCNVEGREYRIYGYQGKQVRDNIHAEDVAALMLEFYRAPRVAEVYNLGGGKENACSILEAFAMVETLTGRPMRSTYVEQARIGDHICYYSDLRKLRAHYPQWEVRKSLARIFEEITAAWQARAAAPGH